MKSLEINYSRFRSIWTPFDMGNNISNVGMSIITDTR